MVSPGTASKTQLPNPYSNGAVCSLPVATTVPLCVDLDGSLVNTDTLWESFWLALRTRPFACLYACLTLLSGCIAAFKRRIANLAVPEARYLPYSEDVLALLSNEANAGRCLILATAADELIARHVAQHVGLFEHVIASDGVSNRKGREKLAAIRGVTSEFVYVGDSMADMPIWEAATGAIVVGDNPTVLKSLRQAGVTIYKQFQNKASSLEAGWRALRSHQWAKNLLVFLPIVLGHRTLDLMAWRSGALVLLVFCLVASGTYLINDLVDIEADRHHPTKRKRPLAAGTLSIPAAGLLLLGLASSALVLSMFLPRAAQLWVVIYLAVTLFYSFYLKTRLQADVVGLAMLYAMRVMAGGGATAIVISPWTIAFCLFFFYSLALIKRFGELQSLPENQSAPIRRGYRKVDLPVTAALGASSGVLSVLVLALYISSPDVAAHYHSPQVLWLACPLILYWFGRIWILTNRGEIAEDPLLFSLKDRASYAIGACMALIWAAASIAL